MHEKRKMAKIGSIVKIVRFSDNGDTKYGILSGGSVEEIEGKPYKAVKKLKQRHKLSDVKLLAPCEPTKIIAMGLNYHEHAKEMGVKIPSTPLTFLKPSTAVIGHGENIVYPSSSCRVDYEGEMAVIMKKAAWRVPLEEALDYVLGYTCFNDVTARDLQKKDIQWTRAKSFDTFAVVGPWLETDFNPNDAVIETYLNGELKQKASTSDMIYSVAEIIHFISHVMTLLPGDIIATGTPCGIGPMYPGDNVEVKIKSLGTLRNKVVSNGS